MFLKSKDFRDLNQPGSYEQPLMCKTKLMQLAAESELFTLSLPCAF